MKGQLGGQLKGHQKMLKYRELWKELKCTKSVLMKN